MPIHIYGPLQPFIESTDVVGHMAETKSLLEQVGSVSLLTIAGAAQLYLKLLTIEFLFRIIPSPPPETTATFWKLHLDE